MRGERGGLAGRRYEQVFVNKITDYLGEEFENETWLS